MIESDKEFLSGVGVNRPKADLKDSLRLLNCTHSWREIEIGAYIVFECILKLEVLFLVTKTSITGVAAVG